MSPDRTGDGHLYEMLLERLAHATFLPDKPQETVDSTLRSLWLAAAGQPMSVEAAERAKLPGLAPGQVAELERLIERRLAGEPLSYIVARQSFMGLELLAGPEALIPRRETELLGRMARDLARTAAQDGSSPLVVDVCTGSGNIALAVATEVSAARVFGSDMSPEAVDLARRNAERLGLASRVTFRIGDLLNPFEVGEFLGRVDVLVCNPPYISSGKLPTMPREIAGHEPREAFDGGPLGIAVILRLLAEAPRFLRAGGRLAFEVGAGQGSSLLKRARSSGAFADVTHVADERGIIRVIVAQC
jgi:release factor glutamine methyltransferase